MGVALTRIPNLSPLSDDGDSVAGRPTMTPPLHFREIRGTPHTIKIDYPPYQRAYGNTAARHRGLAYEAKVQCELIAQFSDYHPEPTVDFYDSLGWRRVRPDGVLERWDSVVLFEIKIQSMYETWWQTEKLYKPVLLKLFQKPVVSVHVVRSFDPSVQGPEAIEQISRLEPWIFEPENFGKVGVFEWRL
jgi:hypothetical protein